MKELNMEEVDKIIDITAVYIDNCKSIKEELMNLGINTKDCELIYEFKSSKYKIDNSNYIVIDLKKVEEYKNKRRC